MSLLFPLLVFATLGPPNPLAATDATLRIATRVDTDTGSMHYAERLRVSSLRGGELVFTTTDDDVARGRPLAPILGGFVRLDADHALLLGWSSWGGGMQTYDALVVAEAKGKLVLVDRIAWTGDRGSLGWGVAIADGRIGFPRASTPESACTWRRGTCPTKPRFVALPEATPRWAAPFAPTLASGEASWFVVTPRGFAPSR